MVARDDRGRLRAPRRSAPTRSASSSSGAASIRRLHRAGPTSRWSASSAASRWPAGTSSARRSASRSTSCSAAGCTRSLRSYTYLYPKDPATRRRRLQRSRRSPPSAPPSASTQGFTAVKFDPVGPYTAFDPRQPSLDDARSLASVSSACSGRRSATRRDLLFGTHGQFTPVRRDPPRPAPRALRPALVRGADAARDAGGDGQGRARDTIPIATGERLTTKYEFARVLETGAAVDPAAGRSAGSAACSRRRRSPRMAEAHYAQIAPHLYCGPVVGRRQHPARHLQPELPDPREGSRHWGGFHAEILKTPIRWEDGYVIPPTGPGPRRRARRGGRRAPSLRRRASFTSRCWAAPSSGHGSHLRGVTLERPHGGSDHEAARRPHRRAGVGPPLSADFGTTP